MHPSGAPELERGEPEEVALQNALRKALAVRAARGGPGVRPDGVHPGSSAGPGGVRPGSSAELGEGSGAGGGPGSGEEGSDVRGGPGHGAPEAILGVDTLVALDGSLYGKPPDRARARATLRALSGRTHRVISGVALLLGEERRTAVACTEVTFRALGENLLEWYLALGEWRERAGGYAIQGAGAALVRELRGDYENVVGLPLAALLDCYPELLAGCK